MSANKNISKPFGINAYQFSGDGVSQSLSPLQVTVTPPPNATVPEINTPFVWVWFGTIGGVIPDNIDDYFVLSGGDGDYYVYAEINIDTNELVDGLLSDPFVTSAELKVQKNSAPNRADPDPVTGNPPEKVYHTLARVRVLDGDILSISNTGTGSLGIYVYNADTFWRNATAGDPNEGIPPKQGGVAILKNIQVYRN